jgi:hypothetical protein
VVVVVVVLVVTTYSVFNWLSNDAYQLSVVVFFV